jgi:hypothetical protein
MRILDNYFHSASELIDSAILSTLSLAQPPLSAPTVFPCFLGLVAVLRRDDEGRLVFNDVCMMYACGVLY